MAKGAFYDEGNYVAEVTGQGLGKAKTGTLNFVLGVKILGTPSQDGGIDGVKQRYNRTIYMYFTDATIPFVVETLRALGYTQGSFGPLDPGHPQHQSFVGQQIDVYCKHEIGQDGEVREKWSVSRGLPAVVTEPLNAKEVRELDALFGKALKASAAPGKGNSKKQVKAEKPDRDQPPVEAYVDADGTEISDEDIPF
jgi:hypothetical protein